MLFLNLQKPVQAKLVGSTVVAAFRNSNPSIVWKFDLERNHSFTLALQGEEDDFELGVTSSKGEFYSVARFASREEAEEALLAIQKVLMKKKWSRLRTVLTGAVGLFAIIVVYSFLNNLAGHTVLRKAPVNTSAPNQPAQIENGVPMPADQVLQPPSQ